MSVAGDAGWRGRAGTARFAATQAVKRGLFAAGHYARRLRRDRFPGVAVLAYHGVLPDGADRGRVPHAQLRVSASQLEAHCALLARRCHPISLEQWLRAAAGEAALPERPVLVTFDDGYRSVLTLARPILARHRVPAIAFICSGPIASGGALWHDAVAAAHGDEEVERLKRVPYEEWRRSVADGGAAGSPTPPLLTADEVGELARSPGWEVGGHTTDHPILAGAPLEEQRAQIAGDRELLASWCGRAPRAFAYPNGEPRDYDQRAIELVAACGYAAAFSTRPGFARDGEAPLDRPRFVLTSGVSAAELAHRLCYAWRGEV